MFDPDILGMYVVKTQPMRIKAGGMMMEMKIQIPKITKYTSNKNLTYIVTLLKCFRSLKSRPPTLLQ